MPSSRPDLRHAILSHLRGGGHLTVFLDYDGTLVPIAATPDEARPDPPLLNLLQQLAAASAIRTVILSGRSLEILRQMLPVRGIVFAGLYGVEMQVGEKSFLREPANPNLRNVVAQVRERWTELSDGRAGFLIEDKGQAVALHARWARQAQADRVLKEAREALTDLVDPESFRVLDGERYLEVAPLTASKGETVEWFLAEYPIPLDLPVAFGDDNKDDAAFAAVQRRGGYAIGVGHRYPLPGVDERVKSYEIVREWLHSWTTG